MSPRIVVLGGVTAAGKTHAAIEIAKHFGGELVGADSVQVYRGFDIGSAKPSASELAGVAHHLIDIVDPDADIDAARYAELASRAIEDIAARGRVPIVVGGSGLWIRALLRGLIALPAPDPLIRARLEARADRESIAALHAELSVIDPEAAARIHPNDRLRTVRALEVFEQTGTPLGRLQAEHARGAPRYASLFFALDRERDALYASIRARTRAMIEAGWIEEVRALLDRWGQDVRAMKSVGYAQIAEHVLHATPIEETARKIYKATRIYTRRQRTWFRGDPSAPRWTSAEQLLAIESLEEIERFLNVRV